MDPDQIKREIFALIVDVKLLIAGSLTRAREMPFDSGGDIGSGDLLRRSALRGRCCYLWQPLDWRVGMCLGEQPDTRH